MVPLIDPRSREINRVRSEIAVSSIDFRAVFFLDGNFESGENSVLDFFLDEKTAKNGPEGPDFS